MKSCNYYKELISPYIDNMLSQDEKKDFEAHINSCDDCKQEFEMLKTILGSVNGFEEEVPETFKEELHSKLINISTENNKDTYIKKNRVIKYASAIAACVLIILTFSLFMNNFNKNYSSMDISKSESMNMTQSAPEPRANSSVADDNMNDYTDKGENGVAGIASVENSDMDVKGFGRGDKATEDEQIVAEFNKSVDLTFSEAKDINDINIVINTNNIEKTYNEVKDFTNDELIVSDIQNENSYEIKIQINKKEQDIFIKSFKDRFINSEIYLQEVSDPTIEMRTINILINFVE